MKRIKHYLNLIRRFVLNMIYMDDIVQDRISMVSYRLKKGIKFEIKKNVLENKVLTSSSMGVSDVICDGEEIIVSLTTHGKRVHSVFRTVESIFQQTYKANRVILWLGNKEFSSVLDLPMTLQMQIKRGLEIKFVKDIRAYTKLIPALREFPNSTIITVDDDFLYPIDMIERLVVAHRKNPTAVCGRALIKLELEDGRKFRPYGKQTVKGDANKIDGDSRFYVAEGYAGVLYPPHALPKEALDEELFMQLAPYADDIWYKAMEIFNSTPIVHVPFDSSQWDVLLGDESVQDVGLWNYNVNGEKNDVQLKAVFDHFDLYDKLK